MSLVLASASPRRREILQTTGFDFTVRVSDTDETIASGTPPQEAVQLLAKQKAAAVAADCPDDIVIGADTVVTLDGEILGKPHDTADAARMLRQLSGRTHDVYTGVCIAQAGGTETFYACTRVTFYPLTEKEIADYIATGEPMDKAGAYGIQGRGCTLVEKIDGDYFNVVGLPVAGLCRKFKEMGICGQN